MATSLAGDRAVTEPALGDWTISPAPLGTALTLEAAVRTGVDENLSFLLDQLQTEASDRSVAIIRSALLPQITTELAGRVLDPDVATSSLGSNPERLVTATASFRQLLFSELALARLSVERRQSIARSFELDAARLLLAESSGAAFLDVLRAHANLRVQESTLSLARKNLDVALGRRRVGGADPAEVARLRVALYQSRGRFVAASGQVRTAEVALNQLLNRDLGAAVLLAASGLAASPGAESMPDSSRKTTASGDPSGALSDFIYAQYLDRPEVQKTFTAFWIEEARQKAPELQALRQIVHAEERQLASSQRRFVLPELALTSSFTRHLVEEGAGSSATVLGGGIRIPTPPSDQWSAGLSLSFPLFEGGARIARVQQAQLSLQAVRTRLALAEQRIEQQVRNAAVELESAYVAALQAVQAETSAEAALEVIRARYAEGTEDILALIDAQQSTRIAGEESVTATYAVYTAWLALQQAAGVIAALQSPGEQASFDERLRAAVYP